MKSKAFHPSQPSPKYSREQLQRAARQLVAGAMVEALRLKEDAIPEGYYTLDEISKLVGRNKCTVAKHLTEGKCEPIRLNRIVGNQVRKVLCYKLPVG